MEILLFAINILPPGPMLGGLSVIRRFTSDKLSIQDLISVIDQVEYHEKRQCTPV